MDPLSITASVIAVLQLTNSVMSICSNYRSTVKNAPNSLRRTIELTSLRDVLERLVAQNAESGDSSGSSRLPT